MKTTHLEVLSPAEVDAIDAASMDILSTVGGHTACAVAILFIPIWVAVARRLDKHQAFILGSVSWIAVLIGIPVAGPDHLAILCAWRYPFSRERHHALRQQLSRRNQ